MLNTQHPPCPSCPLAPHWHPSSLCVSHITHFRTSRQLRYSPTPLMDCIAPSVQKVNTSQLLHPVNSIITSIINSIILGESAWATSPNILFVFPAFPVHSEFYIISYQQVHSMYLFSPSEPRAEIGSYSFIHLQQWTESFSIQEAINNNST